MTSTEYLVNYIKKLGHPIKEIRERSLQLLTAKLRLGWEIEDELSGTRELLEALLAWFHVQKPTLQREALQLLLSTLMTKAGNYIAKEYGIERLLAKLDALKPKIDQDASGIYQELIESIKFLNTVEESNVDVPRLTIPSISSSESDRDSNRDYLTGLRNDYQSSRDGSVSNEDPVSESKDQNGIQLLLFPWVMLTSSDSKTVILVEDALKLLKSTRRCCRFICDVFLRDFPPEIFLNRPAIVQNLLLMADTGQGGRPNEALLVLLSITRALNKRVFELSSVDLVNDAYKVTDSKEPDDGINSELQELAGNVSPDMQDDSLAALKQWPAPLYALETCHAVLTIMARSVVLVDPEVKSEVLDVKTLNTCLSLVESLIQLILECVTESFWVSDHSSKTHRDIAHKSCMVMRLVGDLMTKYKISYTNYPELSHHRVAWFRLVRCAKQLLRWARRSALPPSSLLVALQAAQLDPALGLFYPRLSEDVCEVLQNTKISTSNEFKTKYRELSRLIEAMDEAVKFMKNKNSCRSSKQVLKIIKKSLPVIEIHSNEGFLDEVADILLKNARYMDLTNEDWTMARSIALSLMAHNVKWVAIKFYSRMADMVKSVLVDEDISQIDNEKCLSLLCDVSIMTEICCHGMSSNTKEVKTSATDIMLYLVRGRMVLSESCWWRLLASLLPILPLLHVYAAHETEIGQAICKSLEPEISECMGVSASENMMGLVRLLFVQCVAVRMEAAHQLCRLLGDTRYLPPRESLRTDVLLNALRRIKPESFNVDYSSSPSNSHQVTGLSQILDVLKQDIVLDENGTEYATRSSVRPALEPSLRRSSLQQLSVLMRQQGAHDAFLRCDGIQLIVSILRMSLMVDDYLAFPECAISCVSILNSVCFASRHILAKIHDLPALLIRVILVFPANDSAVLMSAQVLALIAWSGFALQELDANRCQVPALPLSVVDRTVLPFNVNSYWSTSPNAEHSIVEWLLSEDDWRASVRVRWFCAWVSPSSVLKGAPPPAPLALRPTADDIALLRTASPVHEATRALLALENATAHKQVFGALDILESYTHLVKWSPECADFGALPWHHMRRFLCAPPASPRDVALLIALLHFIVAYMDNFPSEGVAHSWIKSCFLGKDTSIIALLSRDRLFPQQTAQDSIEITQLHIHIIKVVLRCVVILETYDDFDSSRLESLVKILLACLEKVDLRNFHMLGYLNELMRCIRYALNSRYCRLSSDTRDSCLALVTRTLSGCCAGSGRKGQACRLDAVLALLAMMRQIHEEGIPPQRWSDAWSGDAVRCIVACAGSARASLRAAALRVIAQLARYAQLTPQLLQAIPSETMAQYAVSIISNEREANAVRAAAATLLTVLASRPSPYTDVLENEILHQLQEYNFLETCIESFVEFCNETKYQSQIEPNVPLSVLERRSELEVRAEKCGDVRISPSTSALVRRPPTAALVAALADVLHNVEAFKLCPVQAWNEQGLYRLMFKCTSWSRSSATDDCRVHAASCRALVAAAPHKCVRAALAATKDCLHNLMTTLTPLNEDELTVDALAARTQALLLLGSLLPDRSTSDSVWTQLRTEPSTPFFSLLLQCLESDVTDFQDAALFCLTQLSQSAANRKHPDKTRDDSCIQLLDNMKALRFDSLFGAGDANDCRPEYLVEELCRLLMLLYQNMALRGNVHESSQDERWCRLCSCLASLLSVSARARLCSVHRQFARALLATLQSVRDRLSVLGQPVEVIRNANTNPTLRTLYWVLTLISCLMTDCLPAKESLAEDNIALSLNRLWPWCMTTEQLREAAVHLLLTFSNNCPKAWSAMCLCVGGRSLVLECCALLARETAAASRARSETSLLACVRVLRHAGDHHHCRAVILKVSLYELCHGGRSLLLECCALLARETAAASRARSETSLLACVRVLRHAGDHHHCRAVILKVSLYELCHGGRSLLLECCALLARETAAASRARSETSLLACVRVLRHAGDHHHCRAVILKVSLYELCHGGRSLVLECCALLARETAAASRARSETSLLACVRVLRHAGDHHHCRAVILKVSLYELCHGGRSLLLECCALLARETAAASRTRSDTSLLACVRVLRHAGDHHHCRAVILKVSLYELCHGGRSLLLECCALLARETAAASRARSDTSLLACVRVLRHAGDHHHCRAVILKVSLYELCHGGRSLVLECCALLARETAAASRARSETSLLACVRVLRHAGDHHHCRAVILKVSLYELCHGGRSLLLECCALLARETAAASRARSDTSLLACVRVLRHAGDHHHCRAVILKVSLYELCHGGRSLLLECCALLARETSRARSDTSLLACVRVLRHAGDHHHCRAVILKSEALSSLHKMRPRARSHALTQQWSLLCCSLARHADGAAAVLALKPRSAPLAAVAHAACHPSLRPAFLNDPELLEMLTGSLLTGDVADIVSASRAVWALAANNHKAKLLLRSARVPLAVHSAQQRLQRSSDPAAARALQLIAYTRSVLTT